MDYTLGYNINIALNSIGIDSLFLIKESFLGYKYRKREKILYDQDKEIPSKLIKLYYGLDIDRMPFDILKKAFITHYINEESRLEGVDVKSIHSKAEIDGFRDMYDYIHSEEIDNDFNIYTLKTLHKILYSRTPYPEFGGTTRVDDRYLPGTGTELCPWWAINQKLYEISPRVDYLVRESKKVKESGNTSDILNYIDEVVELNCDLILIHPFADGNGRCVRGFINKLLEYADLPPIYVKSNERTEYHRAMNLANNEHDYTEIKNFYKYKICDSIVELDINQRIKDEKGLVKQLKTEKNVNN